MRVLYDGVIYRIQRYGGVVRYFNGLIRNLPSSVHPVLLAPNRPAVAPEHPNLSTYIETCEPILWPIKPLRKKIIARRSYNRVTAVNPDVIHPTYYYSSLRNLSEKVNIPTVLTVYDLIHEKFAKQMDPYGKQIRLKSNALNRADAIICISESTKTDLLNTYALPEDRVSVIYPGCDFEVTDPKEVATTTASQISPRYLLYIGERGFYKNFGRLLKAFADIVSARKYDLKLRCVGGKPFSKNEKQQLAELNLLGSVSHCGFLSDSEMKRTYAEALALVYPSLYEGFGIPIIEGMTCGTPVLTSDRASMPEVAGDAAILFNPYSVESITESIRTIAEDESLRQRLIAKGLERAKNFSLAKSALQTVDVYKSVSRRSEVAA